MKIGLIIDGGKIARWQAEALKAVADSNQFIVYDCTNSRSTRQPLRHGLYYLLNLMSVRNPLTAASDIPQGLEVAGEVSFECEREGAWERLPEELLRRIRRDRPEVIVKFGMGLLRVPPKLGCPILSYHHGDPRHYRGRPAGFYELRDRTPMMGQVVQILSDKLDAGTIVAFAETRVHRHSWRRTLLEAYRASALLLRPGIRAALAGERLPIDPRGRNHRLPANRTVAAVAAGLGWAKFRRVAYGALLEKGWQVAEAELPADWSPERPQALADSASWRRVTKPKRYRFIADPFFVGDGTILAEAMRGDGTGEIVAFRDGGCTRLPIEGEHCSYPATCSWRGNQYFLPEISDWSPPRLFELDGTRIHDRGEIDVPGKPRLLDATLFERGGTWFLFGNRADEGDRVLRLWVADSPLGPFQEHRDSPVRISPAGSRMGGAILERGGLTCRLGQDLSGRYGDGLIIFRIDEISREAYRETELSRLRFADHRGPHTLNIRGNRAVFDFYDERLTPFAGIRRLRQSRAE